jgi:hypothetical protein
MVLAEPPNELRTIQVARHGEQGTVLSRHTTDDSPGWVEPKAATKSRAQLAGEPQVELSREAEGRRLYGDSNSCCRRDRTPATGMAGLLSRPAPGTSSENWRGRVIWEALRRSAGC